MNRDKWNDYLAAHPSALNADTISPMERETYAAQIDGVVLRMGNAGMTPQQIENEIEAMVRESCERINRILFEARKREATYPRYMGIMRNY